MTEETRIAHRTRPGMSGSVPPPGAGGGSRRTRQVRAQPYIDRRLQVEDDRGQSVEYDEIQFFATEGPLVVLGEPGIGKSRLVEKFCERSGSTTRVNAVALPMHESLQEERYPKKIVIDEVDAITADSPRRIVTEVLKYFRHFRKADFVLTCRSADWVAESAQFIKGKWGTHPTVGTLQPLNMDEIARYVDESNTGQDGYEFFFGAMLRGLESLLGNPQLLNMFLKSTTGGWPGSKHDLYENVCFMLAREKNPMHKQFGKQHHYTEEELLDTAGYVLSQLLLSGTEGVETRATNDLPCARKLTNTKHDESRVTSAISTGLFCMRADGVLIPHHRTIAEFLAAKWIAGLLDRSEIQIYDAEALLRARHDMVPSSLRGLHAWIATLDKKVRQSFILRDPYGFWCYGDRDMLKDEEVLELLNALNRYAKQHPGFYGTPRGRTGFGRWPNANVLRSRIRDLMRDRQTPREMIQLLVESVHDASHTLELKKELIRIVLDPTAPNRSVCLTTLGRHISNVGLSKITRKLLEMGDRESLDAAIDATCRYPGKLSANLIVDVLMDAEDLSRHSGIRHLFIHEHMPVQKIKTSLSVLKKIAKTCNDPRASGARKRIFPFLGKLFEFDVIPTPSSFWEYLRLAKPPQYHKNGRPNKIGIYLTGHPHYRLSTQEAVILSTALRKLEQQLLRLQIDWPVISLTETDWIFHLKKLATQQPHQWKCRWRILLSYGRTCQFSTDSMANVREFAKGRGFTPRIDNAPKCSLRNTDESALESNARRIHETSERELDRWRARFAAQREQVTSGIALDLLHQAALEYLGLGVIKEEQTTPEERVEELAGKKMLSNIRAGIRAVVTKGKKIPTARDLAELRAHGQASFYENILLMHISMSAKTPGTFHQCRPNIVRSALAVHHFKAWAGESPKFASVSTHLEKAVLKTHQGARRYFRDIVEPLLASNATNVPGIELLCKHSEFSRVAGQLACEWIKNFHGLDAGIFRKILDLAIKGGAHRQISKIVKSRVRCDTWPSPEERGNFMCAAFELDFTGHSQKIIAYANEDKTRFWDLARSLRRMKSKPPEQIRFVIETFAPQWPETNCETHASREHLDASLSMYDLIGMLRNDSSDAATDALCHLAESKRLGQYHPVVRSACVTQRQSNLDRTSTPLSLIEVRRAFARSIPVDHRHLQTMIVDALADIQKWIRNSDTDEIDPYWTKQGPRCESFCRNRLKSLLATRLDLRGVSVHMEASMPRGCKADLLCRFSDDMMVPIEIKRHWNPKVWVAPKLQLPKYARILGANRTAVYLVLWFGYEPQSRAVPRPPFDNQSPRSAQEFKKILDDFTDDVPYSLETFVMDLSRSEKGPGGLGRPSAQ